MIIYVDIDNTITKTIDTDYMSAFPIYDYIDIINKLYEDGHYIVYWTSRGVGSGIDYEELTKNQLYSWGCKYHELKCNKPVYDFFIDDKTLNNVQKIKKHI
jgi:hypothetical protein